MIYCFDLDGTICSSVKNSKYEEATPFSDVITEINRLKKNGDKIIIDTARGSVSGTDHSELTKKQLHDWGVEYDELIMHKKPFANIYIDDRAISADVWRSKLPLRKGILAGCFDIIHPGYIQLFQDAKNVCNYLIIALHIDPSVERPHKLKPIHTIDERKSILMSIKYIDEVVTYLTEADLLEILKEIKPNVRIVGSDYVGKRITGDDLPEMEIYYHKREHKYSYTNLRNKL